jgi:hypothetical protein
MEIMHSILSGWIEKDMGVAAFFLKTCSPLDE